MAKHPCSERGHAGRALACLALGLASNVTASAGNALPDVVNPEHFQCVGRNRFSGLANVPVERQGENVSWSYAAFFVDPVLGTPTIIYGARFRTLGPLMRAFVRRHECQHANGVQDEIAANCAALAQWRVQGLTPQQEAQLEHWHVAEGQLDPQYGGSGAAFWERTVRCAATMR